MFTILGLGNPDKEYENTRHNVGMMVLDLISKEIGDAAWKNDKKRESLFASGELGKEKVLLLKPQTFMNRSGLAVKDFAGSPKKIENLIVVQDDVDLPLGRIKISKNRSSGGHKGVESVIKSVKSEAFTRVRIGISPETASGKIKKPSHEALVDNFITKPFRPNEIAELKKVLKRAKEAVLMTVAEGTDKAMGEFNKK